MRIIGCLWIHLLISWRQGSLTEVKTFNSPIFVVYIDVSGVVTRFITVIIGRDSDLCVHTCRCCGIPVKIFLMSFRPCCDTNILDLTSLRCLIYSYCISPVRCIDILDSSLRLGHGVSNFYVCCSGTNTNPRSIILNVIKVNMVLTSSVLMIARFDRYLVISVRLACCFIPANIVLAVLIRPSRDLNGPHPFRTVDILDDDIKCSRILVVVLDQDRTRTTGLTHFCRCLCDVVSLVILIHIVDMDVVLTIFIFMI